VLIGGLLSCGICFGFDEIWNCAYPPMYHSFVVFVY
jgi:hypothetical protein